MITASRTPAAAVRRDGGRVGRSVSSPRAALVRCAHAEAERGAGIVSAMPPDRAAGRTASSTSLGRRNLDGMNQGELAAVRPRLEEFAAEVFAPLARADQRDKGLTYLRG